MTDKIPNTFQVLPWNLVGSTLTLQYQSELGSFSEVIEFPIAVSLNDSLTRLIDVLACTAAVSYAKACSPTVISFNERPLTLATHEFVQQLFDEGMREFAVHNNRAMTPTFQLAADIDRNSTSSTPSILIHNNEPHGIVIPMGGGRDSSVVAHALAHLNPTLLSIGHNSYVDEIARVLNLTLIQVKRSIDPSLLRLNAEGVPNGHIPITAINSLISLITAHAMGSNSVVMANELSSSSPTRIVDSVHVNHQFSKSFACETSLRQCLASIDSDLNYFSALRDRTDNDISRAFIAHCPKLHTFFMSCNQAMLRDVNKRSDRWCCQCPKCQSVFLSLAPYTTPEHMVEIFGHDLLDDPQQLNGFAALLDASNKPFECVGDIRSAQHSLFSLQQSPQWMGHNLVQKLSCDDALLSEENMDPSVHYIPDSVHACLNAVFNS